MTVSDDIRALAGKGLKTAEISRRLGIRYQHVYNVLKRDGVNRSSSKGTPTSSTNRASTAVVQKSLLAKPELLVDEMIAAGFVLSSRWILSSDGELALDRPLPKAVGVYAFVKDKRAQYIGVATMGLAKRIYFYQKPGVSQRTSQRINQVIKEELRSGAGIEIYTAGPPDLEWNGLPVHGSAGLELGLIRKYALLWNMRSAEH